LGNGLIWGRWGSAWLLGFCFVCWLFGELRIVGGLVNNIWLVVSNVNIFALMKRNKGKYKEVDYLPTSAMTVTEFAAKRRISQSYVYKMIERNTADYQIVIFKTMNFIVPLTND
jgi:hypothetical protein